MKETSQDCGWHIVLKAKHRRIITKKSQVRNLITRRVTSDNVRRHPKKSENFDFSLGL